MKLLSLSSGRTACGIADYNRHLVHALDPLLTNDTLKLPTKRVARDQLRELVRFREYYKAIAHTAQQYDVVLLQYHVAFWNGGRPLENMLPMYLRHVTRPQIMVLHEWPNVPGLAGYRGNPASRIIKRALTTAWLLHDVGSLDYERWMRHTMFDAMGHIIVHAPELRDQLLEAGVPSARITTQRFPVHEIPTPAWTRAEVVERFRLQGRRTLLLLGHPIPRKGFDVAVRALPKLPSDVSILLVSAQTDDFARTSVAELREVARKHGVADRLVVSDFLDDAQLAAVFSAVTLALSPFRSVVGSSSLAHFFAAGLPVAGSDLPAIRATVDGGAGVRLFRSDDPDDLARVVGELLASPRQLQELREKARAYVRTTSFPVLAATIKTIADELTR